MKTNPATGILPVKNNIRILFASSLIIAIMAAGVSIAGILCPKVIYPANDLLYAFYPHSYFREETISSFEDLSAGLIEAIKVIAIPTAMNINMKFGLK